MASIRRAGLKPRPWKLKNSVREEISIDCIFCVPVVPNVNHTYQWVREIRGWKFKRAAAIQFRIADNETVWFGYFGMPHERLTAAQAFDRYLRLADARGFQVIVPRKIESSEIKRIRRAPQLVGWRYLPGYVR